MLRGSYILRGDRLFDRPFCEEVTQDMGKESSIMKRILPVLAVLVLIVLVGGLVVGKPLLDKYSYGTEEADLDEYFGVTEGVKAIVLQDELTDEQVVLRDGYCYVTMEQTAKYFNDGFYVNLPEGQILYTGPEDTAVIPIGGSSVSNAEGTQNKDYTVCFEDGDTLYMALDFLKDYANFSYEEYDRQIQLYTEWGEKTVADANKKTWVRTKGGIKSPVLKEIPKGETVEILEKMETWCKVKTEEGLIGYVELKRLEGERTEQETPVTDYAEPVYKSISLDGKVCLGWHSIGGVGGNSTLEEMVVNAKGMNVISPTWFSLIDNEGNFRSFAQSDYVARAHRYGLQVWAAFDDFNYHNETGKEVDMVTVLSSTEQRQSLAKRIADAVSEVGADGLNIDFERIGSESAPHFIQFLRELSVECRERGLILSVDNYVPLDYRSYYRFDVQGKVADYVIIMGYDEHYRGSGDPGSVASIDFVMQGINKTLESVPNNKVINAIPFYTIVWTTKGAQVTDEYLTLNNTADFLKRVGREPEWDDKTCQNYLEWTSGEKTYSVWLEDEQSILTKLNFMSNSELAGVAVWRLGYGTPSVWELLNIYKNAP